jgi:DNA invertase Pin-like site-specific DNA recombinase
MSAYIRDRGWSLTRQVEDIGSGAKDRPGRDALLKAARRRERNVVVVRRPDRRGRSLPDPVTGLRELTELGVGLVSLMEAPDLTTPTARAMAGMVAVFAEFEREILRSGSAPASHGRGRRADPTAGRGRPRSRPMRCSGSGPRA